MSFTLPFKKLLIAFASAILFVEILVRIFPLYYFDKPEKFLMTYTKNKIEKGDQDYKIIILGDSRSMSLKPDQKEVYNFSLPAMGTRYYKYFVKKYLKYNKKPKAILFAGSPTLVHSGKGNPLVDQKLISYVYPDIPLMEYLYRRTIERIRNLKSDKIFAPELLNQEFFWEFFSHRFLFLFTTAEISEIYRGPEWFFIISQSIPLNYSTYKYRDAIKNLFNLETYLFKKNLYGTESCNCTRILEDECQPADSNLQDNLVMKLFIENNQGYYNISDRIPKKKLMEMQLKKEEMINEQKAIANFIPNFDFSYTKEFIEYLHKNQILYIYITVPFPDYFQEGVYLKSFFKEFENFLSQFPNAKTFYFSSLYYDKEYYPDQVHLNCFGAEKLNQEFQKILLPEIIKYVDEKYYELYNH
ncbi:MAG: hypothetical protein ACK4UJ_00755 [Leptonema sp. (in: bacteria)]